MWLLYFVVVHDDPSDMFVPSFENYLSPCTSETPRTDGGKTHTTEVQVVGHTSVSMILHGTTARLERLFAGR